MISVSMVELLLAVVVLISWILFLAHNQKQKKIVQNQLLRMHAQGVADCQQERYHQQDMEDQARLQRICPIGGKVISVPNEWDSFVVGTVIEHISIGNNPPSLAVVEDDISGKTMVCFGPTLAYRIEMVRALLKLDPFERYSLAISSKMYDPGQYIFDKQKSYSDDGSLDESYKDNDEIAEILRQKGYDV